MDSHVNLSRRERQIMDLIYEQGDASVNAIRQRLPNPPIDAAVRRMLRILEEKGHVKHRMQGRRLVYSPTKPRGRAARSALKRVLKTFFDGSMEKAVATYLSDPSAKLDADELKRLSQLIREAETADE